MLKALILLEGLLEHYDENLRIIETLSNVIAWYEDKAAEFDGFNKRQTAINLATTTLTVLIDQGLANTDQV
jgi:HTH-type transcriptional regulator / antitoxin HigA